ncbi:MAG: nuclease-related domain-containing protein [Actinomycetota bacterium]|nr:nuclease-related domain-containing protein [Actinomycetota bacterium]
MTASDAGASLRREADRRAAKREATVKERFPRVGGLLLAISGEPATTQSLRVGAEGERKAAERILGRCGESVLFLLNRRLGPGLRNGDIDMLAVTAEGIHVIDIKYFKGAKVEVRRSGGLFTARTENLWIGGRNRTNLLDSMRRQLEAVESALASIDRSLKINVKGTLCFVDANLPLLGTLHVRGVEIRGSREMGRKLRSAKGLLGESDRRSIYAQLAEALPSA